MSTELTSPFCTMGNCLVAMPSKHPDPFFDKSVIYICAESDQGVMGVMINKPIKKLGFSEILSELRIESAYSEVMPELDFPIMKGGPIESTMGFILHSPEYENQHTVKINPFSAMTATIDIIKDIAKGNPPKQHLMALGYAGWEPDRLIEEMERNLWLTVPGAPELLFDVPYEKRWAHALRSVGIEPSHLSITPGTA